jgi:hypothetical protein
VLDKPLLLILDEFDALREEGINTIAGAFRNIYISRIDKIEKTTEDKTRPISMSNWEYTYMYASRGLPNDGIWCQAKFLFSCFEFCILII